MIKTTCFGQHWPMSGFSSERFVCCKSVYINALTAYKSFGWKKLTMANVGRNV